MNAKIRCVCGKTYNVKVGGSRYCSCGTTLVAKNAQNRNVIPWARTRKQTSLLSKNTKTRKHRRPKIVEWN